LQPKGKAEHVVGHALLADVITHAIAEPGARVAPPKQRRTRAEIANDRIEAEQLAQHEPEVELQRVRDAARLDWEAARSPEDRRFDLCAMDYSRFSF
jgi:hypothetical protein